jgi:hypothetical protein
MKFASLAVIFYHILLFSYIFIFLYFFSHVTSPCYFLTSNFKFIYVGFLWFLISISKFRAGLELYFLELIFHPEFLTRT